MLKTHRQHKRRHTRIRKKVCGTAQRPRLAVFKSLAHTYAQLIDDSAGTTLAQASTLDKELRSKLDGTGGVQAAREVGKLIGQRTIAAGHKKIVFDRGGHPYHGRVKSLAEGAREAGLEF
jgi:large subunit ribosomal protein L18